MRTVRANRPPVRRGPPPAPAPQLWLKPHPNAGELVEPTARLYWRIVGRARDGAPIDRTIATRRPLVEPLLADLLASGARITAAHPSGWGDDLPVPPQPKIL